MTAETRFTNLHGIDPAIARAITHDPFYGTPDCDITVTALIRPPQMAALEQTHADEITEDVSDRLWALLGQAAHKVVEAGAGDGELAEGRLYADVAGWKVGGKADLYRDGQLVDYKVTSVYSFLLGDKPDWETQLNYYAYLWRANGFPVERLTIAAILRDWSKSKAGGDDRMPAIPFQQVDVNVWSDDVCEAAITKAVEQHQAARQGQPRPCTPDERWERPTRFAAMKRGQKRAVKLFDDEDDATSFIEDKRPLPFYLEERPGQQVRCADYCSVRRYCRQADELGVPK